MNGFCLKERQLKSPVLVQLVVVASIGLIVMRQMLALSLLKQTGIKHLPCYFIHSLPFTYMAPPINTGRIGLLSKDLLELKQLAGGQIQTRIDGHCTFTS